MIRSPLRLTILGLLLALSSVPGCATIGPRSGQALVPTRSQTRTGPYAVFTHDPIAADAPEIRNLQGLERQLMATLGIRLDPSEAPVEVYILDDRASFEHFLRFHFPELPTRRAFFIAQGSRRVVYAYRGDRLVEDLRHEGTHALLHAAVADLPLWLDEGLAEYFEVPPARDGLNAEHLARVPADLAAGWTPDLARLEGLTDVRQMSPRDYRESWGWVHFLLNGPPSGRAALLSYLAELHQDAAAATPLSRRLGTSAGVPGALLVAHLSQAKDRPIASTPPGLDPVIRLQDPPSALPPSATKLPRRRGLLGRLRDWVGF